MTFKRFLSIALSILMVLALVPAAVLAEEIGAAAAENAKLRLLDNVWAELNVVEAQAIAAGAERAEVVTAMYKAVLQNDKVDEKSISELSSRGFFFRVDGMLCAYDYVASTARCDVDPASVEPVVFIPGTKNCAGAVDVLLVGPYYTIQSTFTDQYKEEAQSIANATGGSVTILQAYGATGPAIAANYTGKGVVIYDSHGTQEGTSSYLCLTTNEGITSQDYSNGWAVSSGSAAFIDGRYIQHHVSGTLSNCLVWMAICEGMKKAGQGTTGTALLAAGAGVVYGYSQSVTFSGDYEYEEHFWNNMKNNNTTVAEAFNAMTAALGNWDPAYSSSSGAAWPIVMSPDDPFPSNPDSHQTVNCDWTLMPTDPIALEGIELEPTSIEMLKQQNATITLTRIPNNANSFEVQWASSNYGMATVTGNNKGATIHTADTPGTVTITAYATDTVTGDEFTATVNVTIRNGYILDYYEPVDTIETGVEYLIGYQNGNDVFVIMNYNPNPIGSGNNYYYSYSSNYYGYGIKAVVDENGYITGVDNSTYANATIDNTTWFFETNGNYYKIASAAESVYLGVWSSGNYEDMYPGGSANTQWSWDASNHYLKYNLSGTIKYATFIPTAGSYSNFFGVKTSATSYSNIKLYKHHYEVVFEDDGIMGDADGNGVVDSVDAILVLRYALGIIDLTDAQLALCDMDGNGVVDSVDAIMILRAALRLA